MFYSYNSTGIAAPEDVVYYALNKNGITVHFFILNLMAGMVGFTVVFLNALVLSTMIRDTPTDDASYYIIANMAIGDMFCGFSVIHTVLQNLINFQNTTECLIRIGAVHCFFHLSASHLLFLTVTRYVKIIFPFHFNKIIQKNNIIAVSLFLWALSLLFGSIPLLGVYNKAKADEVICRYGRILTKEYLELTAAFVFYPVLTMNLMYAHIMIVSKKHQKTICHLYVLRTKKRSWRFTKTVIIICGAYCCCALPLGISLVLLVNGKLSHLSAKAVSGVFIFAMMFAVLNSLVNPIIYAIKMPSVNSTFNQVFCRECCKRMCPVCVERMQLREIDSADSVLRQKIRLSSQRRSSGGEVLTLPLKKQQGMFVRLSTFLKTVEETNDNVANVEVKEPPHEANEEEIG